MFKKTLGILALLFSPASQLTMARQDQLEPISFEPNLEPSYPHIFSHLQKRAELLSTQPLINTSNTAHLTGVSACQNSNGQRYIVAFYAHNNNDNIASYEARIYDPNWQLVATYTNPLLDNSFEPNTNLKDINLRTLSGPNNNLWVFNRYENSANIFMEVYYLAYAPSEQRAHNNRLQIHSSDAFSINTFEASLSPDKNSLLIVSGQHNRFSNRQLIRFSAFEPRTNVEIVKDPAVFEGIEIVSEDAINPDVTHLPDNSSMVVLEHPSNQTITLLGFNKKPDFSERLKATGILQQRRTPKINTLTNGHVIVATIGLDNRVYLSEIDRDANVIFDQAITASTSDTVSIGKPNVQGEKVILSVSRENQQQKLHQLSINQLGLKNEEVDIAVDLSQETMAISVSPISQNQTDILYLNGNSVDLAHVNTDFSTVLTLPPQSQPTTTSKTSLTSSTTQPDMQNPTTTTTVPAQTTTRVPASSKPITTISPLPTENQKPTQSTRDKSSPTNTGLTGVIAGVIGGLLALGVSAGAIVTFVFCRRSSQDEVELNPYEAPSIGEYAQIPAQEPPSDYAQIPAPRQHVTYDKVIPNGDDTDYDTVPPLNEEYERVTSALKF